MRALALLYSHSQIPLIKPQRAQRTQKMTLNSGDVFPIKGSGLRNATMIHKQLGNVSPEFNRFRCRHVLLLFQASSILNAHDAL